MNRRSFVTALLGLPIAVKAVPTRVFRRFGGWVMNFGAGVPATLHGSEVVLSEAQVREMKARWESLSASGPIHAEFERVVNDTIRTYYR